MEMARAAKTEEYSSSEEEKREMKSPIEAVNSDHDDEANEDLSLKIVQKSLQQRTLNKDPREDEIAEIVTDLRDDKKKRERRKRKKSKEIEAPEDAVDNVRDKEQPDATRAAQISAKAVEINPVDVPDNAVLKKLLRGPRYFDPPENSWGACYNCGEEGHTAVNCMSAKRKKPCFVCGSFEHNAKQCSKGHDCFICKQQGHRAKDCPERNNTSKMCLKCGDLGHDMFSCRNDYYPDDIKEIQCYVCGRFCHLCCANNDDPGPREVSCYKCGLSGHTGLACTGFLVGSNGRASASACYKCGAEGHFARECTSLSNASKRNREPSTPKQKSSKKKKDHMEVKSAPQDLGKTRKKKKPQFGEFTSPAKTKHRGGWITEDPGDFYGGKARGYNLRSPATPSDRRSKVSSSYGDYASSSHSSRKSQNPNFINSLSNSSNRIYQHYSASRLGYKSNDVTGRYYNWW